MAQNPEACNAADPVERAMARVRGVLPDQGPIGVFIHHNTLHAFQHLPFHQGVQAGAAALKARPYLSLDEFRELLHSGRISRADVQTEIDLVLGERGGELVGRRMTRAQLWLTLLTTPCDVDDAPGLEYTVSAGTAPQAADRLLWAACVERASRGPRFELPDTRSILRHRDAIVALEGPDVDVPVHGELIRLASGFLDHGQAHAHLPGREEGFFRATAALYAAGAAEPRACRGLAAAMRIVAERGQSAREAIDAQLEALGVRGDKVEPYVTATALALPGWAGMFSRLELHPEEHHGGPPRLEDFLAVRLLFDRTAADTACADLGVSPSWEALHERAPATEPRPAILDAALLWWIAREAGWTPGEVRAFDSRELTTLWRECQECPDVRRRQLFQEAYERAYREIVLDAVAERRAHPLPGPAGRPRAQFVFCIDEREESIRRALEELSPSYVTYGVAGFFGIAIDYRGLYDREAAAYCPVVVTPGHEIHEQPVESERSWHVTRKRMRSFRHGLERRAQSGSRSMSGGAGMSFLLGPATAMRTLAHVMAPRSMTALREKVTDAIAPRPTTRLSARRAEGEPPSVEGGKPLGFSLQETVDRVASTFQNIGLLRNFAPVVVFLGHGSTSLNNPHESAHDCGACGGRRGGANARLIADMANRPDVRAALRQRDIEIPDDVWFVGALHDTADDSVRYFDLDARPASHDTAFEEAFQALEAARRENARERSRRFDDAPLDQSSQDALKHVQARSALLAQVRPEYGHCTNAICIVGRRETTRGLYLDRRAFLVSYDPTLDVKDAVLERILAAVGPVGAGISLEYYFSAVDNETFGCGTKLPHNVTGLIGVMNGHQSDLRTGLPLQMVEIHEPMRLLVIAEATPQALLGIASRQAEVAELVVNAWIQLVSMDPATGALAVFERGGFVPYHPRPVHLPHVDRSPQWFAHTREHLPPALVGDEPPPSHELRRPALDLAGAAHA